MKLKELFTNPYFTKGVKITEYAVLSITAFCGIFWAAGFYYLGILLGIVSLLLVIAKICLAKYETEDESIIKQEIEFRLYEKTEEKKQSSIDSNEIVEEDVEDFLEPKFTLIEEDTNGIPEETSETIPEETAEIIPDGMFDSVDEKDSNEENSIELLERELTPYGKELLNEWKRKCSEYEKSLECNLYSSENQKLEEELDMISNEIQQEREKFLKQKEEEEEALKKAKNEEKQKRLEARRAMLGL